MMLRTEKVSLRFFFLETNSFVSPQNLNLVRPPPPPPFMFFAHISKFFDEYQMPIFFIGYLGSLQPVKISFMCI